MQGDLRISPYSAPCGDCPEKGCGAKHTTCEAYIAFRASVDEYKKNKAESAERKRRRAACVHGSGNTTEQNAKGGYIIDG